MKINNPHREAEVQGVSSSKFGFEMNAKMYDILLSKMYTNKPGAVIRELSANAWDAHVEAGNTETPFDIQLPTWLDQSFFIRDYGTGIPHDSFESVFTNVGASTKEGSNDFIGGFGLGSKTPFTLTDTFLVENWREGRKTSWVCFKDKGEPQVSLVSDEPSEEPNGVKVSFSFDDKVVPEFTKQVVRQLSYFPVKPNITGGEGTIEFPELPEGWDTRDYFFKEGVSSFLVMGNVAYDLPSTHFNYKYRGIFDRSLIIKAPIGSVDVPPSRETLELTTKTRDYVNSVLDRILREYKDKVQLELNKCETEFQQKAYLHHVNTGIVPLRDLTWNNKVVKRVYCIREVAGYSSYRLDYLRKNKYRKNVIDMEPRALSNTIFYVNDLGPGYTRHINETWGLSKEDGKTRVIFHLEGVTKKNRDTLVNEALSRLGKEIGDTPKLLSSLLGFPKKLPKGTTRVTKEPTQVYKVLPRLTRSYGITRTTNVKPYEGTADKPLPDTGYFVELKGSNLVSPPHVRLEELLYGGIQEYLSKPVYLVRSKSIPKLPKGMESLTKTVLDSIVPTLEENLIEHSNLRILCTRLGSSPTRQDVKIMEALGDRELLAYARLRKYLESKRSFTVVQRIISLLSILRKPIPKEQEVKLSPRITKVSVKCNKIHDVVRSVTGSYSDSINQERFENLISLLTYKQESK